MKNKLNLMILIPILVYPAGDFIAQIILQDFNVYRLLSLLFLAVAFYQWEIPMFFKWIASYEVSEDDYKKLSLFKFMFNSDRKFNAVGTTTLSTLYFNPLWIARHMFFITIGASLFAVTDIKGELLSTVLLGAKSFMATLPVALIGNYIIQNKLSFKQRFLGSAVLSGMLAIAYAISYAFL